MDNIEELATLPTQDEENTEGAIKNGQSRRTGNIAYTGHRRGLSRLDDPEELAILSTQDIGGGYQEWTI